MNYKVIYILLYLLGIGGCQQKAYQSNKVGMPNPASVYCAQLHGKSIPVFSPQGEYAICTLPRGEKIEEWTLFRRDHSLLK